MSVSVCSNVASFSGLLCDLGSGDGIGSRNSLLISVFGIVSILTFKLLKSSTLSELGVA